MSLAEEKELHLKRRLFAPAFFFFNLIPARPSTSRRGPSPTEAMDGPAVGAPGLPDGLNSETRPRTQVHHDLLGHVTVSLPKGHTC